MKASRWRKLGKYLRDVTVSWTAADGQRKKKLLGSQRKAVK